MRPTLVIVGLAFATMSMSAGAREIPWKPVYAGFACSAAVTFRMPASTLTSDVVLGVESDPVLKNRVEVAAASVISPGSIRAAAIRDQPNDVKPEGPCVFRIGVPVNAGRRVLHVRVGDGIPVVLLTNERRLILPPGTVSHGGRIIEDDGRLFVLSVIAAAYRPDTYKPRELQQKGASVWITPFGFQRRLEETADIPFVSRLDGALGLDGARVATYAIGVVRGGKVVSVEPLNLAARDPRLTLLVTSLRLKGLEVEDSRAPVNGRLSLLL